MNIAAFVVGAVAIAFQPSAFESWINTNLERLGMQPMPTDAPLNLNLDKIPLPTQASETRPIKFAWCGDSQMIQTPPRLGGQFPLRVFAPITGMFAFNAYQTNASIVSTLFDDPPIAGQVNNKLDLGTAFAGLTGTEGYHPGKSIEFVHSGNVADDTLFYEIGIRDKDNFRDLSGSGDYALRMNERWIAEPLFFGSASTLTSFQVQEYRQGSQGNKTTVSLNADGTFQTTPITIRSASEWGVATNKQWMSARLRSDTGTNETGTLLDLLGAGFFRKDTSGERPDHGLQFLTVSRAGYSSKELGDTLDQDMIEALVEMFGGFDTVALSPCHNADTSGTITENWQALMNLWTAAHLAAGYDAPKFLLVAMWASPGAPSWTAEDVEEVWRLARSGGHGFINEWDTYNGVNPEANGADFYGTPTAYTLDAGDLHPNDEATAAQIVDDILAHMDPVNWKYESRSRSRDRQR